MTKQIGSNGRPDKGERPAHRVRLPGFVRDEEIGLGDAIKRATSYFGMRPCGGCERRAAALNRWMAFTNRRSK
jgi:hypothetical protein